MDRLLSEIKKGFSLRKTSPTGSKRGTGDAGPKPAGDLTRNASKTPIQAESSQASSSLSNSGSATIPSSAKESVHKEKTLVNGTSSKTENSVIGESGPMEDSTKESLDTQALITEDSTVNVANEAERSRTYLSAVTEHLSKETISVKTDTLAIDPSFKTECLTGSGSAETESSKNDDSVNETLC